jgi:diguanylate cyclase (GGDEF)-like protein
MSGNGTPRGLAIIADDEDLGRLLLAETAAASGLEALCFDNGASALEAALSHEVDIILLDVDMPGMDGYAVCRRLRADARFATVPIVMVTGHEDAAAIGRAFDAGATDFVSKPVNWALLPRRLAYILRNAAAAERIERLAYYDTLTGLANRQRCIETAERLFESAATADQRVAIVYTDLNSFKRVNDTFGHAVGDAMLRSVAAKLVQVLAPFTAAHPSVSVARFGGDEFVILVADARAAEVALEIGKACSAMLKDPISHDGLEFYAAPRIGLAVYPDDGADVASVLKHADTARNHAKLESSGAIIRYTPAMSARLRDWLDLEGRLRRALHEEQLTLHYQPKFRLNDNGLIGVEALLRWCDAEYGDIPPTRFIEIAEDSGLIIDLGVWVIRAVCRQLGEWQRLGIAVPVAVNVSGKELLYGDPARAIEEAAAAEGVATALIEVEITESLLIKDSARVQAALERLRGLGCRIALDDFGTGYSSLAYITRFPPDRIKIDKAFVHNIDRSESDAAIANAILSLGDSLHVIVTAEGIERQAQLEWLRKRGCHEAQGYLLSRPLPAETLTRRLLDGDFSAADPADRPTPARRPFAL